MAIEEEQVVSFPKKWTFLRSHPRRNPVKRLKRPKGQQVSLLREDGSNGVGVPFESFDRDEINPDRPLSIEITVALKLKSNRISSEAFQSICA